MTTTTQLEDWHDYRHCSECNEYFPKDKVARSFKWCGYVCEDCWKKEEPLRVAHEKEMIDLNVKHREWKIKKLDNEILELKTQRSVPVLVEWEICRLDL